jgi:phospholipase C
VKAGDVMTVQYPLSLFTDSNFAIEVYGPSGFYRELKGNGASMPLEARAGYEYRDSKCTGNVILRLRNHSNTSTKVEIADNAYQAKPVTKILNAGGETSVVLHLEQSFGWYDFTVKSEGTHSTARFAGRVETGSASKSDPAMGRIV